MSDEVYKKLAEVFRSFPNGFPETKSGIEIRMLKRMFTQEEAEFLSELRQFETAASMAEKFGASEEDTLSKLNMMVLRRFVRKEIKEGVEEFRLQPFIVGVYEAHMLQNPEDHEFAHLFEIYMAQTGAKEILEPRPGVMRVVPVTHSLEHRVVPVSGSVKPDKILPEDDIRGRVLNAKSYMLLDCICRIERELEGHACKVSGKKVCFGWSAEEIPENPYTISKEEAIKIFDDCEAKGLVHLVINEFNYHHSCMCCGCCCGVLRGLNDWGLEEAPHRSNYRAVINSDECIACGTCIERCQVHAISEEDDGKAVQ